MTKILFKSMCVFLLQLFIFSNNFVFSQNNLWSEIGTKNISLENKLVQKLKSRAIDGNLTHVKLDKTALNQNSFTVILKSFQNPVIFFMDERQELKDNGFAWYGRSKDKKNSAVFVVTGNEISGNVQVDNKTYNIIPIDNSDTYAIYQLDTKTLPEIECGISSTSSPVYSMSNTSADATSSTTVIRLLVAYTTASRNGAISLGYTTFYQFIQQVIAETNQSFINSNVAHRVELACLHKVSYSETGGFTNHKNKFMGKTDGVMDEVHNLRTEYNADVCVLIVDDTQYCGLAAGIGSNYSSAFCVVHYDCAVGYYSFGHEIGHLHGCRHDPDADNTSTPYAYGHGYVNKTDGWRTVMAYNNSACPNGNCIRVQYWSNPDINYSGDPTGTTNRNDNARVLDETSGALSNYSLPPSNLVLSSSELLNNDEAGYPIATNSIKFTTGFKATYGSTLKAAIGTTTMIKKGQINDDNTISSNINSLTSEDEEFSVYPNPINDNISIAFNNFIEEQRLIQIYSLTGHLIYQETSSNNNITINLSQQPSGLYVLKITSKKGSKYQKLIKS